MAVYDRLAKVMYDDEREIEYSPLTCMNDDEVAGRIQVPDADACIFVINATQKLNSKIAINFKTTLQDNKIDFLIPYNKALEDQLPKIPDYANSTDIDTQLFYEKPYLETQELINETNNLQIEKKDQTGLIVVSERGTNRKDRYTSCSYGDYFINLLEQDIASVNEKYSVGVYVN